MLLQFVKCSNSYTQSWRSFNCFSITGQTLTVEVGPKAPCCMHQCLSLKAISRPFDCFLIRGQTLMLKPKVESVIIILT